MTDWDAVIAECAPRVSGWTRIPYRLDLPTAVDLGAFIRREARSPLHAIITLDLMDAWNAGTWLHLSVSRPTRLPTWGDLVIAREELGYTDRAFVQLLPPKSHWLNIAGHVLHLFHRIDAETVPRMLWDQEGCDGTAYRKPAVLDGKGQI